MSKLLHIVHEYGVGIIILNLKVQVEIWRKERVNERQYETSYKWLAEKTTQGILYQLFSIIGAQYRKPMFILWQFIYTTIAVLISYNGYHR
jgi:hypothetical protein